MKNVTWIGSYNSRKNRPVCIELVKKISADFLYEKHCKRSKGVFADCEYNEDIEHERLKD